MVFKLIVGISEVCGPEGEAVLNSFLAQQNPAVAAVSPSDFATFHHMAGFKLRLPRVLPRLKHSP